MADNVNIIVQDTINDIVVNAAVVVETIDINVQAAVDTVDIVAKPEQLRCKYQSYNWRASAIGLGSSGQSSSRLHQKQADNSCCSSE
jgi:hypothetical protein